MTLKELLSNSGDSNLLSFQFNNGVAQIEFELDELDETVQLSIKSESIFFKKETLNVCHLKLVKLSDLLQQNNGMYIPCSDFGQMMNETRERLNLAYGKKIKDYEYILQFRGYGVICAVLIENLDSISINEIQS